MLVVVVIFVATSDVTRVDLQMNGGDYGFNNVVSFSRKIIGLAL